MTPPVIMTAGLFGVGFVMGLRHALDADHVAAVSTVVSRTRSVKASSLVGLSWSIGHGIMLLGIGSVIAGFKVAIPAGATSAAEFLVGTALVALGARAILRARDEKLHLHAHEHGGSAHAHLHGHAASAAHEHVHVPLLIGMAHGIAGSGTLAVLAMAAAPSLSGVLWFMATFSVGTTFGMLATTAAFGFPLKYAARFPGFRLGVIRAAGTASVVVGLVMMAEIGAKTLLPA